MLNKQPLIKKQNVGVTIRIAVDRLTGHTPWIKTNVFLDDALDGQWRKTDSAFNIRLPEENFSSRLIKTFIRSNINKASAVTWCTHLITVTSGGPGSEKMT